MTEQERYEEICKEITELYARSARSHSKAVMKEYEKRIDYLETIAATILR